MQPNDLIAIAIIALFFVVPLAWALLWRLPAPRTHPRSQISAERWSLVTKESRTAPRDAMRGQRLVRLIGAQLTRSFRVYVGGIKLGKLDHAGHVLDLDGPAKGSDQLRSP